MTLGHARLGAVGIAADRTFVHFLAHCQRRGVPVEPIDVRAMVEIGAWRFDIPDKGDSWARCDGAERVDLSRWDAVYVRLIDLSGHEEDALKRGRWRGAIEGLRWWLETTDAHVVNRPDAQPHNAAKALHEWWIAGQGLDVPDSLTSSDKDQLVAFAGEGGTIVKPGSGMRANARLVTGSEFDTYRPEQGPVHLQRQVPGDDVRAHVVGEQVIAVRVRSELVDYRRKGGNRRWWAVEVPEELAETLVAATARLGLSFAGWDFKVDTDERYWCLEANPMPGYTMYDGWLDGAISDALIAHLTQRRRPPVPPAQPARVAAAAPQPARRAPVERAVSPCHPTIDGCDCGAAENGRAVAEAIHRQHLVIDAGLDAPARWRGLLRRDVQAYGAAGERERVVRAFNWLEVSETTLRQVHGLAVGGEEYRDHPLGVPGFHGFPEAGELPTVVPALFGALDPDEAAPLRAARLHLDLLSAHPFSDGNGRTSRLMATLVLLRAGYRSTLLTAVEQFFHNDPPRYVAVLESYRRKQICKDACQLRLLEAMRAASSTAAWYLSSGEQGNRPVFGSKLGRPLRLSLASQLRRIADERGVGRLSAL
jgi:glutathione synthase/RimK-type ligase-like ATP-grasp enzyme